MFEEKTHKKVNAGTVKNVSIVDVLRIIGHSAQKNFQDIKQSKTEIEITQTRRGVPPMILVIQQLNATRQV